MDSRMFNSIMPEVNECWAASALGMNHNEVRGVDLVDKDKAVEIKFNLLKGIRYNYISWKIQDYQYKKYPENHFLIFWGLGTYTMSKDVKDIITKNIKKLETLVIYRELYIVDWSWVGKFKSSRSFGETDKSDWDYYLRYPKHSKLPKVIKSFRVKKGIVHITKNVPVQLFLKGEINAI